MTVLIDDAISCFDVVNSGIILKFERHDLVEGLFKTVKLLNEVLLLLLDIITLFLLKGINLFFKGKDHLFTFIELLLGLIYQYDINLMLIKRDLMLFKQFNHTLNFVNEDFNLRGKFLVITNDLHYLSQKILIFW